MDPFEQRCRRDVSNMSLNGTLDEIVSRVEHRLKEDFPEQSDLDLRADIVEEIFAKLDYNADTIPDTLFEDLFDTGYLNYPADDARKAVFKTLSKAEQAIVAGLESHVRPTLEAALIRSIQEGNSPVSSGVLSALSWSGLQALNGIIALAAAELFKKRSKSIDPVAAAKRKADYKALSKMVFPKDKKGVERAAAEEDLLQRVNLFIKPAPAVGPRPKFR